MKITDAAGKNLPEYTLVRGASGDWMVMHLGKLHLRTSDENEARAVAQMGNEESEARAALLRGV